jgi:small-conductance mechanosensitive channel
MNSIFTADYWSLFWQAHAENVFMSTGKIAVIVIAYLIVRFLMGKLIKGALASTLVKLSGDILQTRKARLHSLRSALTSAVGFILAFVAVVMILQTAGINIIPLITTASIAGLAIGFGAQKLVRDVISGFFILMEDQYGIGDYVTIGAVTGSIEDLEMRTTRIRDASGKLYILSNGDITQVCNHSRGKLILSADYPIAPASDLDKAREVLEEVGKSMAADFPSEVKEPLKCEGLAQISAASSVLRLTGAVSPSSQDSIRLELNARVRRALDKNGIALA